MCEKIGYTIDEYRLIDDLIDESMDNIDDSRKNVLTTLKRKIYNGLVSDGLKNEVESVIREKWDVSEHTDENGFRVVSIRRKG